MELIGKPTINPWLFYTGKISGYIVWIIFVCEIIADRFNEYHKFYYYDIVAFVMFVTGLLLVLVSLFHLGKSTRLGLPSEQTKLKTNGIYKISRNPMYVGFGLFTLTSMIYVHNIVIIIAGIYSLLAYHLIIKSEEEFLSRQFGIEYKNYINKVRRYL
ncbi:MAG: isoprenylcysteine carboxylmethyltransferase family protein [Bacteroidetes bacterium]|nr:isoprenylcysteine carboxylmethyltransferase family protein [Bacteroidota bacterium]